MKKPLLTVLVLLICIITFGQQTQKANINIKSATPAGTIDPKIYGQLFEHIYFSADGGLWGEMIAERSFEPEQYPGISPREGFFDGWFADDDEILHSPTLFEQPIPITTVNADKYVITTDVKWRSYKLAQHMWSGGYADMRVVFKNSTNGKSYRFRLHDPQFEPANPRNPQPVKEATFAIERESTTERQGRDGKPMKVSVWEVVASTAVKPGQLDKPDAWHNIYIEVSGSEVKVNWDDQTVLKYAGMESNSTKNDIAFGVNYTEAQYKNIQVSSIDRFLVYMTGMPEVVINPPVAPQWKSFGNGSFEMIKDNAVNMKYSQKITAGSSLSGVQQGPFSIKKGETYVGYVWAKGDGNAELTLAFTAGGGKNVATQTLGKPDATWKKYEFKLNAAEFEGDANFTIGAKGGKLQVDQVSMMPKTGINLGGYRPDIYKAVEQLGPTNLRWPGGGYAAQYSWKWGVGPQEKRERWAHYMWMNYDQNNFGTDEFLQLCHQINSEPVMVVRIGFDRPQSEHAAILQEACDWVAYCNEPATGKWGSQRAANGHAKPYNVKYWEIDNEMWEFGIDNYEAAVREFSTAMRKVDPSIKIIVCGGFGNGGDKDMLNRSGKYFDYLSLHHYENPNGYATGPGKLAEQYKQYADMIAKCPNPNIKLYISEWNLSSIDWRTGLFAGGFLNVCENQPVVEMGAAALFIRRTDAPAWNNAFINFDYKGLFVAPNYLVTKLWHDSFSKTKLAFTGETSNLSISTTLSENGKNVIVKVVNPSNDACELTISGDWKSLTGAGYEFIAPGSLMIANSMESPNAVKVEKKALTPINNKLTLTLAPLSAGVVTLTKR